ncbi:reprolysin-like metallopeptidase, partial [Thalassotalea piscium]
MNSYAAKDTKQLWNLTQSIPSSFLGDPTTFIRKSMKGKQSVLINKDIIRSLKVGDTIILPLLNNKSAEFTITTYKVKNSIVSITGKTTEQDFDYPLVLTLGERSFFGRVVTSNTTYSIKAIDGSGELGKESVIHKNRHTDRVDYLIPPKKNKTNSNIVSPKSLSKKNRQTIETESGTPTENVTIKWLVAYTSGALQAYPEIETKLVHIESITNQIYIDSGVNLTLEFVHKTLTSLADSESMNTALYRLSGQNGYSIKNDAEVKRIWDLQLANKADFMTLIKVEPSGSSSCGLGWVLSSPATIKMTKTVVDISCADYVVAHEIGHNMGLKHSYEQGDTGANYDFGRGYGVANEFVTVMAYASAFGVWGNDKIYKYSSPELTCKNGMPCGIDKNLSNGADAVYALNAHTVEFGKLYDESVAYVKFDDAIAQLQDQTLAQCIKDDYPDAIVVSEVTSIDCYNYTVTDLKGLSVFYSLNWLQVSQFNLPCWQVDVVNNIWGIEQAYWVTQNCKADGNEIQDFDNDGMSDEFELANGLNPLDPTDALVDSDNDGLISLEEYQAGTDPTNSDTDGDGVLDGDDLSPLMPLTDNRGIDFNSNGLADLLLRNKSTNQWYLYGIDTDLSLASWGGVGLTTDSNWTVQDIGHLNNDVNADVLVRHDN